jgi:hypothetical protein
MISGGSKDRRRLSSVGSETKLTGREPSTNCLIEEDVEDRWRRDNGEETHSEK